MSDVYASLVPALSPRAAGSTHTFVTDGKNEKPQLGCAGRKCPASSNARLATDNWLRLSKKDYLSLAGSKAPDQTLNLQNDNIPPD